MPEITSSLITDALFYHFNSDKGYKYQLCNSYVFRWESDFFCMARSGYSYEIEVKISRSDFFADFRKEEKHLILAHKGNYIVIRKYACPTDSWDQIKDKHFWARRSHIQIENIEEARPNKFCYAVPEGLISESEVPDYAGLIYINSDARRIGDIVNIVKNPPALHRKKADLSKVLLEKYYWAYLNMLDQKQAGKNFQFPDER